MSPCNFDPSLGRNKNSCKIDPPCKIVTRAKVTLRAKVSPCKIVCSCKNVSSCKSVFVQIWPPVQIWQPCKYVFAQFCPLVQICLRAKVSSCNFVRSRNFDTDPVLADLNTKSLLDYIRRIVLRFLANLSFETSLNKTHTKCYGGHIWCVNISNFVLQEINQLIYVSST